jgi:hypothetical protein
MVAFAEQHPFWFSVILCYAAFLLLAGAFLAMSYWRLSHSRALTRALSSSDPRGRAPEEWLSALGLRYSADDWKSVSLPEKCGALGPADALLRRTSLTDDHKTLLAEALTKSCKPDELGSLLPIIREIWETTVSQDGVQKAAFSVITKARTISKGSSAQSPADQ